MLGCLKVPILGQINLDQINFLLYIYDVPDELISNISVKANEMNLPLKRYYVLWIVFLLRLCFIFRCALFDIVWNIVMSTGPPTGYLYCWSWFEVMVFLHLGLLLNPWFIVQIWLVLVCFRVTDLEDVYLSLVNWFLFHILLGTSLFILIGCLIFLSPFLHVLGAYTNSFFPFHIWIPLVLACSLISMSYRNYIKARVNKDLQKKLWIVKAEIVVSVIPEMFWAEK